MAKKKGEAGQIGTGLVVSVAGGLLLLMFGPKALAALKGSSSGATLAKGGGLPGSPASLGAGQQQGSASQPGSPGTGQSLAQAIKNALTPSSKPVSVADALKKGYYTSATQGVLASIFNLQQYGNPYGDAYGTRDITSAFGLSSTPGDSLLSSLDTAGLAPQPVSLFDFGSYGTSPDSYSQPDTSTPDWQSLIDNIPTSNFDFGTSGYTPDQWAQVFDPNAAGQGYDVAQWYSGSGTYGLDPSAGPPPDQTIDYSTLNEPDYAASLGG